MNRPIYIFTGLLDSGKTTSIKNVLSDPRFTEKETTLIICFEEGDEEYDESFLKKTHSNVVYRDFEGFDKNVIQKLDDKYNPDRIFIEFNGMDDDRKLFSMELPRGFEFAQDICLVDASKFKLHVKNMPQFMFNHVSCAQVVVLNRFEGADFRYLRANLKSMNQRIYINLEDANHNVKEFPKDDLFDVDNLDILDSDYGLFYMDVVDNFLKYKDKKVKFRAFFLEQKDDCNIFGRMAMVCCANDAQRLAMKVVNINQALILGAYYLIEGYIRVEREGQGYRLYIDALNIDFADAPESEYVSFN